MTKKGYLLVLIFAFFLFGYFVVVTSFFNGFHNAKFFDDVPDLLVALVSFALIIPSFGLSNTKSKKLIMIGAISLITNRLAQVYLQEYQAANNIWAPYYYWAAADTFMFIGIILILWGFEEVKND